MPARESLLPLRPRATDPGGREEDELITITEHKATTFDTSVNLRATAQADPFSQAQTWLSDRK